MGRSKLARHFKVRNIPQVRLARSIKVMTQGGSSCWLLSELLCCASKLSNADNLETCVGGGVFIAFKSPLNGGHTSYKVMAGSEPLLVPRSNDAWRMCIGEVSPLQ